MEGERLRAMLNVRLPPDVVDAAWSLGVLMGERRLDPLELVLALVFAGGIEERGRFAWALRAPTEREGETTPARGTLHTRFNAGADGSMKEVTVGCDGSLGAENIVGDPIAPGWEHGGHGSRARRPRVAPCASLAAGTVPAGPEAGNGNENGLPFLYVEEPAGGEESIDGDPRRLDPHAEVLGGGGTVHEARGEGGDDGIVVRRRRGVCGSTLDGQARRLAFGAPTPAMVANSVTAPRRGASPARAIRLLSFGPRWGAPLQAMWHTLALLLAVALSSGLQAHAERPGEEDVRSPSPPGYACSQIETVLARTASITAENGGMWIRFQPTPCDPAILRNARFFYYRGSESKNVLMGVREVQSDLLSQNMATATYLHATQWLEFGGNAQYSKTSPSMVLAYLMPDSPARGDEVLGLGVMLAKGEGEALSRQEQFVLEGLNWSLQGVKTKALGDGPTMASVGSPRVETLVVPSECTYQPSVGGHTFPTIRCDQDGMTAPADGSLSSSKSGIRGPLTLMMIEELAETTSEWQPFGTVVGFGQFPFLAQGCRGCLVAVDPSRAYRAWFTVLNHEGKLLDPVGPVPIKVPSTVRVQPSERQWHDEIGAPRWPVQIPRRTPPVGPTSPGSPAP